MHISNQSEIPLMSILILFVDTFRSSVFCVLSVTSSFYRVATKKEVKNGLASQAKPNISVATTDYLNTPIEVVAGIEIAGVYVGSNIETIRLRLMEAIVFRKISFDMEIEQIEDENEDDASE